MEIIIPEFNGQECKKGCNCIDIAEAQNNFEPVKNYPCLKPSRDALDKAVLENNKVSEVFKKAVSKLYKQSTRADLLQEDVEDLQSKIQDLILLNGPYPLADVLEHLIKATTKLLVDKGYDGHDYEEMEQAVRVAKEKALPAITQLHKALLALQGKI